MPRIWGCLALAPLVAATGCTAVLGDFSQTGEPGNDDAGDGSMIVKADAGNDAPADATHDAPDVSMPDVVVSDAPMEASCGSAAAATITPSGSVSYCPGVGVVLTASPASIYAWSNGATTQSITATDPGTYSVTTIDACGRRATSAAVTVTAYPAPTTPTITATATSFCHGSSVTLTASSAASYEWSTGATTQTTAITTGDTYTVTTKDANGCPATSDGFTVTEITPPPGTLTFNYTGSSQGQAWTVPQCVSSIDVDATGASGGSSPTPYKGVGGLGGRVQATLAVTPGQILTVYVGGAGYSCSTKNSGGTNGYDSGGYALCATATSTTYPYGPYPFSGTGGAGSDIRVSPNGEGNRILVAGGGGGAGYNYNGPEDNGGAGGGTTGGTGGQGDLTTSQGVGFGGSQTAGGAAATQSGLENTPGGTGGQGYGGSAYCYQTGGTTTTYGPCGGGGGGGWYGGGSGCWGPGGGGSSYVNPAISSNVAHTQGYQSGNGYVTISW